MNQELLQSVLVAGQGLANMVPMKVGIEGRHWDSGKYPLEESMNPVALCRSGYSPILYQIHGISVRKTLMFYIACFGALEPLFFTVFIITRVPKPTHCQWPLVPKEIKRY